MRAQRFVLAVVVGFAAFGQIKALAQAPNPPQPPLVGNAPPDVLRGAAATPWLNPPAQMPQLNPPPAPLPQTAPLATPQQFDNTSLRLKAEYGKWQLWAGNFLLKDFGSNEREANEALQVFRDLRVNSRGSVGESFEYWLADGQAPSAIMRHKQVIPFDSRTLRVELINGQWVLRDAHVILYGFGRSETEARQALGVCKQYDFNQLGFVGHPTPSLKYLMKDPTQRPTTATTEWVIPASVAMQANELSHSRLVIAGVGDIGDRIPFDSRRLDLRRDGGEWVLYSGRTVVGHFGADDRNARMALEILEQFRITELCRVGESGFGFFLSNGRAPQGGVVGTGARPMQTEKLNVKQIGNSWSICEGSRSLIDFGDHADDARKALAAIREYRFDSYALVGGGRLGNVYLFVKTRY
jgi:hypothetical protein